MTSGVACYNKPWTAHMNKRRRAWHARMALPQHTQFDDVGHGMSSFPLGRTHGQTTSGVTFLICPWRVLTVGGHRACHAIITLEQHTRSN